MSTTIDTVAVASGGGLRRGGRKLADRAAKVALDRAGLITADVDLLINAGLYHDRNLGEPALAALIQEDIGANPEDPHEGGHGTFSFDVANGACGMLTGLQIVDGFLQTGTIRHAVVVASDANPGRGMAPHFPYGSTGGAFVCGWDDGPRGVLGLRFATSPDGRDESELAYAIVDFQQRRNVLRIETQPEFAERAAAWAGQVASELLTDHGVAPADVDVVVANPLAPAFLDGVAARLDIPPERMTRSDGGEQAHTAALAVAWRCAESQGELAPGRTVLLVSAGAGINAGAALLIT